MGDLQEDPGAVARVGVGARGAAVLEVRKRGERADNRLVARHGRRGARRRRRRRRRARRPGRRGRRARLASAERSRRSPRGRAVPPCWLVGGGGAEGRLAQWNARDERENRLGGVRCARHRASTLTSGEPDVDQVLRFVRSWRERPRLASPVFRQGERPDDDLRAYTHPRKPIGLAGACAVILFVIFDSPPLGGDTRTRGRCRRRRRRFPRTGASSRDRRREGRVRVTSQDPGTSIRRCVTASSRRASRCSRTRRRRSPPSSSGSASTSSRPASRLLPPVTSKASALSPPLSSAPVVAFARPRAPGRPRRSRRGARRCAPLADPHRPRHEPDAHGEEARPRRAEVLELAAWAVAYTAARVDEVEFSCEDATRSDPAFVAGSARRRSDAGATVVNLPDTVGYALPARVRAVHRRRAPPLPGAARRHALRPLPRRPGARGREHARGCAGRRAAGRVHRQRDRRARGQRVARGGRDGARRPLRALRRRDRARHAAARGDVAARRAAPPGYVVQRNKAVVGANAFAHEAGIHQDGMLKDARTYQIMDPESVGVRMTLPLGKHSGRHAFARACAEQGVDAGGR